MPSACSLFEMEKSSRIESLPTGTNRYHGTNRYIPQSRPNQLHAELAGPVGATVPIARPDTLIHVWHTPVLRDKWVEEIDEELEHSSGDPSA